MWAAHLFVVEALPRLIVHAADCVAVRQHRVAVVIFGYFDYVRFADTAKLQKYPATNNSGLLFYDGGAERTLAMARWSGQLGIAQFRQGKIRPSRTTRSLQLGSCLCRKAHSYCVNDTGAASAVGFSETLRIAPHLEGLWFLARPQPLPTWLRNHLRRSHAALQRSSRRIGRVRSSRANSSREAGFRAAPILSSARANV